MGVPVITLQGDVHASRVGASLLAGAGLGELVTRSADEYVRLAATLAADRRRLDALSRSLRDRLRASSLCDAAALARAIESAYRDAWRSACARR
jgi:predicted O-linked N-acetylglucosamine transferase (SPINDLY family)